MVKLARVLEPVKRASYERMNLEPGHRVLDLGCGPGVDTVTLAGLVGPSGRVVGIDGAPEMIAAANRRAQEAGVDQRVTHLTADVEASLPLEPQSFDAARSERLFQHLDHPERALSEMVRATRSDGWVVVVDTDWTTASIDTTRVDIEQRIKRYLVEERIRNPTAGRQLYRLFHRQGLVDLSVEIKPMLLTDLEAGRSVSALDAVEADSLSAGVVTEEELDLWHLDLQRLGEDGLFWLNINVVLVAGRKPARGALPSRPPGSSVMPSTRPIGESRKGPS